MLAWNYSALGRHREAIAAVGRALKEDPQDQGMLASAAWINARAGRPAVGRRYVDSLLALSRKGLWVDPYFPGWAYAWLGETGRALASFNRAIEERSSQVQVLKIEFLPEGFRADPRFHALLRRVRLE